MLFKFTHTTWEFNDDGTIGSGHYTTKDELRSDYDNFASNYNNNDNDDYFDEPPSITEWVRNSNGVYVNPNSSEIKGRYIGNVNENGVVREKIGNVYWTSTNTSPLAGTKGLDNLNLIPIYVYYLPNGDISYGDINGTEINIYLMDLLSFSPDEKANMNAPPPNTVFPSDSVKDKFIAMLKAAGMINFARFVTPLVIARAEISYSIISANSDSTCNNTRGGCQSWFNSNYIGASTSDKKAVDQYKIDGIRPIDAVDLAAYNHDVAYDNVGAKGLVGAIFDLNTLQADRDLLAACYNVLDMYKNGTIDPITHEPVSLATRERASMVISAFEIMVTEKTLRN